MCVCEYQQSAVGVAVSYVQHHGADDIPRAEAPLRIHRVVRCLLVAKERVHVVVDGAREVVARGVLPSVISRNFFSGEQHSDFCTARA